MLDCRLQSHQSFPSCSAQHDCPVPLLTLDAVLVKVPHDNAELQLHGAHRLGLKPVSVRSAVNQIRGAQLWPTADEHLR